MGKSSLVHLIVKGSVIASPPQTVGCTVGVKVKLSNPFAKEDDGCIPSLN